MPDSTSPPPTDLNTPIMPPPSRQTPIFVIHDPQRDLLICTRCRAALSAGENEILHHLRSHHTNLDEETVSATLQLARAHPTTLRRSDTDRIAALQSQGYIPGLEPFPLWGCSREDCIYAAETEGTIRAHHRTAHHVPQPQKDRDYHDHQSAQTLFRHARPRWFKVELPTEDDHADGPHLAIATVTPDAQAVLDHLFHSYDDVDTERRRRHAVMPHQVDEASLSLWDKRTRWPVNFAGLDLPALHALTDLPDDRRDLPSWRMVLMPAVLAVLNHCQTGLVTKSTLIRRLFYTIDTNLAVVHPHPLTPVRVDTVERSYVLVWQHLICFLLRASAAGAGVPHLQLRRPVRRHCDELRHLLDAHSRHSDHRAVRRAVFRLSTALLKETYVTDIWQGPLLYFLAVAGYNPKSRTWPPPATHGRTLSQVVHLLRILGLEDALPRAEEDADPSTNQAIPEDRPLHDAIEYTDAVPAPWVLGDTIILDENGDCISLDDPPWPEPSGPQPWQSPGHEHGHGGEEEEEEGEGEEDEVAGRALLQHAREYAARHLRDGTAGPFTEIYSQRLYAQEAAKDFYARPSITWSADRRVLYHDGEPLHMDRLRAAMHALVVEAEDLLGHQLVFADRDFLERRSPRGWFDNMTWTNVGDSFLSFRQNNLHTRWRGIGRRLQRQVEAGGGNRDLWREWDRARQPHDRGRDWPAMQRYDDHAHRLLQLITLAIHLEDLPYRGTELTSLKWANTATAMRNIYIVDGRVVVVADYNKTDSMSHQPKVIAHFLSPRVERLLMAYLVDVLPCRWAQRRLQERSATDVPWSPYLFQRDGKLFTTDDLTRWLADWSTGPHGFDVQLGTARWRQMAVAIDQEKVRPRSDTANEEHTRINHVWQLGHNPTTEDHNYALTLDMLRGLSDETLRQFRRVSLRWHRFWGLADTEDERELLEADVDPDEGTLLQLVRQLSRDQRRVATKLDRIQDDITTTKGEKIEQEATTKKPPEEDQWGGLSLIPDGRGRLPSPAVTAAATVTATSLKREWPTPDTSGRPSPCDPAVTTHPADRLLVQIMGPSAHFRSVGQRRAVQAVAVERHPAVIVRLPPAGGKSLVIQAAVWSQPDKVTIVIVPYVALRQDLKERCAKLGIQTVEWSNRHPGVASLVLVTPEAAVGQPTPREPDRPGPIHFEDHHRPRRDTRFITFCRDLYQAGQLNCIGVDEAHAVAQDGDWRTSMIELGRALRQLPVRRFLMSGTLPTLTLQELQDMCTDPADPRDWRVISEPIQFLNLRLEVDVVADEQHESRIRAWIDETRAQGNRTMVVCKYVSVAEQWANVLGTTAYTGGLNDEERQAVWQPFIVTPGAVLVGTSAVAVGTDPPGVGLVIHLGGSFSLTSYFQHACRAGRDGRDARSVLLLTPKEWNEYEAAVHLHKGSVGEMTPALADKQAMAEFVATRDCRRQALSRYLNAGIPDYRHPTCHDEGRPCSRCQPIHRPALTRSSSTRTLSTPSSTASLRRAWHQNMSTVSGGVEPTPTSPWSPTPSWAAPPGTTTNALTRSGSTPSTASFQSHSSPSSTRAASSTVGSHAATPDAATPCPVRQPSFVTTSTESWDSTTLGGTPPEVQLDPHPVSPGPAINAASSLMPPPSSPPSPSNGLAEFQRAVGTAQQVKRWCMRCWLERRPDFQRHQWWQCPHVTDMVVKMHRFNDGARASRHLPGGVHYLCYLPVDDLHDPAFTAWKSDCDKVDLVRDLVVLAADMPEFQPIFTQAAIKQPDHDYRDLGRRLAIAAARPHRLLMNVVFTRIVSTRLGT